MSDLDPLPSDLAQRSLSRREPVFALDDANEALAVYREHGIGMWGWEAWATYGDGLRGHYPGAVIGLSIERQTAESWSQFVVRSVEACMKTIAESAQEWSDDAQKKGVLMHFCLTPARSGPRPRVKGD